MQETYSRGRQSETHYRTTGRRNMFDRARKRGRPHSPDESVLLAVLVQAIPAFHSPGFHDGSALILRTAFMRNDIDLTAKSVRVNKLLLPRHFDRTCN